MSKLKTAFIAFLLGALLSAGVIVWINAGRSGDSGRAGEYADRGEERDKEYQNLSNEYDRAVEAYERELGELRAEVARYGSEAGELTDEIGRAGASSGEIAERAGQAEEGLSRAIDLLSELREAESPAENVD